LDLVYYEPYFYRMTAPEHSFVDVFVVLIQPFLNFGTKVFNASSTSHEYYEFRFVFRISTIYNLRNELKYRTGMHYSDGYHQFDWFNFPL